ncbi:retropepsin-like aspartic protease family protein [Thiobaca trueperi]|uniref:Aspartyl protease family protein n=1 Tax=Thiobaca trueperi TaxID=127458 RepID=A0A4R3N231_9GAMM|nr:retropepsin-like aspartic protease [Thiobaca trueperi]TCT22171.1 aspartyl protease family protein [Thiobaca trueperi]
MKQAWLKQNSSSVLVLLAVLALVLLMGVQMRQRGNPNPVAYPGPSGLPQVVLKENGVHQYVVTGRINGEPVEFLVDTGCADVAMSYWLAQRLRLPLQQGEMHVTGNGNVQGWSARLDSVDVGGLIVRQVNATVLPNLQGGQVLLGMAYLRHMEVILAGGEMTLRPDVNR